MQHINRSEAKGEKADIKWNLYSFDREKEVFHQLQNSDARIETEAPLKKDRMAQVLTQDYGIMMTQK